MARFYSNENFPFPVVEALRGLGHEVITTQDAGNAGRAIPDDEVLKFAAAQKLVVLTLNRRDFVGLHLVDPQHSGIVVCTFDRNFIELAARIDAAVRAEPTLDGTLIRVNRPQGQSAGGGR